MADILIRMEMPTTCADCHDADLPTAIAWLGAKCPWAHGIIDPGVYDLRHGRHPNCPLHELPEHGDLIDRVAFRAEMDNHYPFGRGTQRRHGEADAAKSTIINMLATAPVVVQASKEALE